MNLKDLVGKTFPENQIYELLHFDIQENYKSYLSKFIHLYFDHLENGQIRINKIAYLENMKAIYALNRKIVGIKAWIEIYNNKTQIDLMICRKDRSGKFSIVGPTLNHTQVFRRRCFEKGGSVKPLTPEQMRLAFAELTGALDIHTKISKPKIAV